MKRYFQVPVAVTPAILRSTTSRLARANRRSSMRYWLLEAEFKGRCPVTHSVELPGEESAAASEPLRDRHRPDAGRGGADTRYNKTPPPVVL
jgi:hypothetical protein